MSVPSISGQPRVDRHYTNLNTAATITCNHVTAQTVHAPEIVCGQLINDIASFNDLQVDLLNATRSTMDTVTVKDLTVTGVLTTNTTTNTTTTTNNNIRTSYTPLGTPIRTSMNYTNDITTSFTDVYTCSPSNSISAPFNNICQWDTYLIPGYIYVTLSLDGNYEQDLASVPFYKYSVWLYPRDRKFPYDVIEWNTNKNSTAVSKPIHEKIHFNRKWPGGDAHIVLTVAKGNSDPTLPNFILRGWPIVHVSPVAPTGNKILRPSDPTYHFNQYTTPPPGFKVTLPPNETTSVTVDIDDSMVFNSILEFSQDVALTDDILNAISQDPTGASFDFTLTNLVDIYTTNANAEMTHLIYQEIEESADWNRSISYPGGDPYNNFVVAQLKLSLKHPPTPGIPGPTSFPLKLKIECIRNSYPGDHSTINIGPWVIKYPYH